MTYDPRKAAQTIAYLTVKNGRTPLNILKAVKLVYLADREECAPIRVPDPRRSPLFDAARPREHHHV